MELKDRALQKKKGYSIHFKKPKAPTTTQSSNYTETKLNI